MRRRHTYLLVFPHTSTVRSHPVSLRRVEVTTTTTGSSLRRGIARAIVSTLLLFPSAAAQEAIDVARRSGRIQRGVQRDTSREPLTTSRPHSRRTFTADTRVTIATHAIGTRDGISLPTFPFLRFSPSSARTSRSLATSRVDPTGPRSSPRGLWATELYRRSAGQVGESRAADEAAYRLVGAPRDCGCITLTSANKRDAADDQTPRLSS